MDLIKSITKEFLTFTIFFAILGHLNRIAIPTTMGTMILTRAMPEERNILDKLHKRISKQ